MIVLTKTFVPYKQFDLDIILKVTAAIYDLNLVDLCGNSNIQAVFIVFLFAFVGSTNMYEPRSLWPTRRSPEVKRLPLEYM